MRTSVSLTILVTATLSLSTASAAVFTQPAGTGVLGGATTLASADLAQQGAVSLAAGKEVRFSAPATLTPEAKPAPADTGTRVSLPEPESYALLLAALVFAAMRLRGLRR